MAFALLQILSAHDFVYYFLSFKKLKMLKILEDYPQSYRKKSVAHNDNHYLTLTIYFITAYSASSSVGEMRSAKQLGL